VHEFAYPAAAPAADPAADPAAASAAPHARATHAHAAYARAAAAYPDDEDYPDLEFEGDTSGSSSGITNAAQYAPQVDESGIPPYPGIASDAAAAAARTLAGEALADAAGTQLETDNPTYEYFRRPGAPVNTAVVLPRDRSEALPLVQPRVARAKKADGPLEKLMKLNQEDPTLALEKLKLERMKLELEMRKVANEEAREACLVKYQEEQQVERRYDEQHHPARRLSPDGSNYSSFTSRSSKSSEPSTRETWQNQWEEYQQRGIQDLQQRMRREAEDRARRQTEEQQLNQRYWDSKDAEEREAKEERKTWAGLRGVVGCDYGDGPDYMYVGENPYKYGRDISSTRTSEMSSRRRSTHRAPYNRDDGQPVPSCDQDATYDVQREEYEQGSATRRQQAHDQRESEQFQEERYECAEYDQGSADYDQGQREAQEEEDEEAARPPAAADARPPAAADARPPAAAGARPPAAAGARPPAAATTAHLSAIAALSRRPNLVGNVKIEPQAPASAAAPAPARRGSPEVIDLMSSDDNNDGDDGDDGDDEYIAAAPLEDSRVNIKIEPHATFQPNAHATFEHSPVINSFAPQYHGTQFHGTQFNTYHDSGKKRSSTTASLGSGDSLAAAVSGGGAVISGGELRDCLASMVELQRIGALAAAAAPAAVALAAAVPAAAAPAAVAPAAAVPAAAVPAVTVATAAAPSLYTTPQGDIAPTAAKGIAPVPRYEAPSPAIFDPALRPATIPSPGFTEISPPPAPGSVLRRRFSERSAFLDPGTSLWSAGADVPLDVARPLPVFFESTDGTLTTALTSAAFVDTTEFTVEQGGVWDDPTQLDPAPTASNLELPLAVAHAVPVAAARPKGKKGVGGGKSHKKVAVEVVMAQSLPRKAALPLFQRNSGARVSSMKTNAIARVANGSLRNPQLLGKGQSPGK
jgi:hypothetical protein